MNTLFSHVCVVTMDERMSVWTDAFVGVTDGKISYLSKHAPEEKPAQIIDATGMVLMPGLINCHTHLPMQLLRGYADDLKLQEWLNDYIFPREDRLDGRCVRAATTLAVAEKHTAPTRESAAITMPITSAQPEASFRLLTGQCTALTRRLARSCMSSCVKWTQCAAVVGTSNTWWQSSTCAGVSP